MEPNLPIRWHLDGHALTIDAPDADGLVYARCECGTKVLEWGGGRLRPWRSAADRPIIAAAHQNHVEAWTRLGPPVRR